MARADRLPTYAVPLAALVVAFIIYSVAGDRHPNVKDVSVSEARELIAAGAVVVDVRDRSVSGSSHINGALLNEAGYTQAVNLKTGIEGWRAANLPTAAIK